MPDRFEKDPAGVLDYVFDFAPLTNGRGDTDWLASGDTISSKTVTAETGLTVDSSSITDSGTSVTAWLSGGTAGSVYRVTCQIVTAGGRTDERSIAIKIRNK